MWQKISWVTSLKLVVKKTIKKIIFLKLIIPDKH